MNETLLFGEELSRENLKPILDKQLLSSMGWGKGDEGKGGDSFALAQHGEYNLIVGPVGGPNAWHTAINNHGQEFVGHNLPGSALSGKPVFLWQGKYMSITGLEKEITSLYALTKQKPNISLASGAHVIIKSLHVALDNGIEGMRTSKIGTTWSGMWPVVASRALRSGLTVWQLISLDWENLHKFVTELVAPWNQLFDIEIDAVLAEIRQEQEKIKALIDAGIIKIVWNDFAKNAFQAGDKILVEWSQSPSLGMFGGAYPNNTSTDTSFLGIMSSLNINPIPGRVAQLLTVKAFPSAVGTHTFPERVSHIYPHRGQEEADFWKQTGEYGATTGRARMIAFPSTGLLADQVRDGAPYIAWVSVRKFDRFWLFQEIVMRSQKVPVVTGYDLYGSPILWKRATTLAELIDIYREAILESSGGQDITFIGWFGPEPKNSRVL